MDNCGPYSADMVDPPGQIKILPLPSNCTSLHQSMDQAVFAAWKARYRYRYLKEIVDNVESRSDLRQANKTKKAGMKEME